jgi:hypothetical protein
MPSHARDMGKRLPEWVEEEHLQGNDAADQMADEAANENSLETYITKPIIASFQLVRDIQKRIAVIVCHLPPRPAKEPRIKLGRPPPFPLHDYISLSKHSIEIRGGGYACTTCGSFVSNNLTRKELLTYLSTPCIAIQSSNEASRVVTQIVYNNVPVHESHHMYFLRGLNFCFACGFCASCRTGELAKLCKGPEGKTARGKDNLRRIAGGLAPRGMLHWPSEAVTSLHHIPTINSPEACQDRIALYNLHYDIVRIRARGPQFSQTVDCVDDLARIGPQPINIVPVSEEIVGISNTETGPANTSNVSDSD